MPVKTVKDIDLKNKRVLMRVDFNVPVKDGEVTDDTRIKAVLPTLKYIIEQEGTSVVLMSHLGRPKGEKKPEYSLKPVASRLSELIGKEVRFADDCVGEEVKKQASALKAGEILLLENVRFHKEETENDKDFARQLASLGQV
ncbi:MAG: phosphoglycerate kinase, partial [Spirochaetes bacterium]